MHIADVVCLILARASVGHERANWSRVPGDGSMQFAKRSADDSPC